MLKRAKENKKGFTLAELLIVVAIIAVLVAISIPIFTSQLEKSREAVDAANIRAAYAELAVQALESDDVEISKEVELTQTQKGWQGAVEEVAGIDIKTVTATAQSPKGTKVVISVKSDGTVSIADKSSN